MYTYVYVFTYVNMFVYVLIYVCICLYLINEIMKSLKYGIYIISKMISRKYSWNRLKHFRDPRFQLGCKLTKRSLNSRKAHQTSHWELINRGIYCPLSWKRRVVAGPSPRIKLSLLFAIMPWDSHRKRGKVMAAKTVLGTCPKEMYIYIYTYVYIYIYMYICTCIYIYGIIWIHIEMFCAAEALKSSWPSCFSQQRWSQGYCPQPHVTEEFKRWVNFPLPGICQQEIGSTFLFHCHLSLSAFSLKYHFSEFFWGGGSTSFLDFCSLKAFSPCPSSRLDHDETAQRVTMVTTVTGIPHDNTWLLELHSIHGGFLPRKTSFKYL